MSKLIKVAFGATILDRAFKVIGKVMDLFLVNPREVPIEIQTRDTMDKIVLDQFKAHMAMDEIKRQCDMRTTNDGSLIEPKISNQRAALLFLKDVIECVLEEKEMPFPLTYEINCVRENLMMNVMGEEHPVPMMPIEMDVNLSFSASNELYCKIADAHIRTSNRIKSPLIARKTCEHCGCKLAVYLGDLEFHKGDCPNIPI